MTELSVLKCDRGMVTVAWFCPTCNNDNVMTVQNPIRNLAFRCKNCKQFLVNREGKWVMKDILTQPERG